MEIKTLYRFTRQDGGITVSPEKPDAEYTEKFRLIADEGKLLTQDGENTFSCVDTDTVEGWYEVEEQEETPEN